MSFELPKLKYSFDSLEPYIDAKTLEIHYSKHHQNYVNKLNSVTSVYPDLAKQDIEKLLTNINSLPQEIQTPVRNNGGGHYNHKIYWLTLTPKSLKKPAEQLESEINATYGDFDTFKAKFTDASLNKFGSGWVWLVKDINNKLIITPTDNQDSPITLGLTPILALDVWEHAYYLKYQNRRNEYIDAWWNIVDWETANKLYLGDIIVS